MFDTLLASPTIGTPWTRPVTAALAVHLVLIVAAVSSTASLPAGARSVARDTIRLEMTEPAEPSRPKIAEPPRSRPRVVIPELTPVPEILLDAPELQPPQLSFSPLGRLDSSPPSLPALRSSVSTEVDELPELMEEPHPRYPEGLRRAGVSGLVQLQYVVGTDGRVDEQSIHVLTSSHPAFLLAALQALRDSRFKPARRGGRPVAVLVQQTIRFRYR